jgi:ABC-2 type transport system permease protein
MDEDPLGALDSLDACHLRRGVRRLHRADRLADRNALVRPEGRVAGRQGHLRPGRLILGTGVGLGQLAICVLGVLVITSEYSTGVIRASLLAVPRRIPVLAAKAVVFAVLLLIVTEIVAFCSFFVGSAILHAYVPVSLSGSGVTRAVAGAGLYLTVLGLLALAIGTMIRHTAGAISTIIGVVFVLPILSGLLPSSWGAHINAYLPEQAGR